MIIGIPKEIKDNEYRVAIVPSGVRALKAAGHRVLIEKGAGAGSSIPDEEYVSAGAETRGTPDVVFGMAELIVKVKEPLREEYRYLREGLNVFTFFHLASDKNLTEELLTRGVTAIAYETIETGDRRLPILGPMSEIAGRLSVQIGAHFLLKQHGGRGVLLSGVPGVERGSIAIIGAGNVGVNAAKIAVGLGAEVTLLDTKLEKFRYIDDIFGSHVKTLCSNSYNIEKAIRACDLLIGATHIPGARTPRLITRGMLSLMKKGSVIVDVSVDQGGCVETIRPTTHSVPAYEVDGVIHYGVANMPGAVPRTSTFALTNATLPYILKIANMGIKEAALSDPEIARGVNTYRGRITHQQVAEAFGKEFCPLSF